MEHRLRMFGQEIAESYALVVCPHLDVQPIVATVVFGEVKRGGIVVVGNHGLFAP